MKSHFDHEKLDVYLAARKSGKKRGPFVGMTLLVRNPFRIRIFRWALLLGITLKLGGYEPALEDSRTDSPPSSSSQATSEQAFKDTSSAEKPTDRSLIVVPMEEDACWQDFAFIAAVPAGAKANAANPAVVAVDAYGTVLPELRDFIDRYDPSQIHLLGGLKDRSPPREDLLAHWAMDEDEGNFLTDSVGSHPAMMKHAPVWTTRGQGGYDFDGKTVRVDSSNVPGSSSSISVSFWMKPEVSAHSTVIQKYNDKARASGWAVMLRKNEGIRFRVGGGRKAWTESDVGKYQAFSPGEWTHVTCTHANGVSKIYLNGRLLATREEITWGNPFNTTDPLLIGKGFTGILDEVRIYDRELSFVEIQNFSRPTIDGLAGYWSLDERAGDKTYDATGNFDLAVKGRPSRVVAKVGGGLRFDGKGDFLQLNSSSDDDRSFSIRFQAQSAAPQAACMLQKVSAADGTPPWSVFINGTDLFFQIGASGENRLNAAGVLPEKTDAEITITYENGAARIFSGKQLVAEGELAFASEVAAITEARFDGSIDNLRLYDRSLSMDPVSEETEQDNGLLKQWVLNREAMKRSGDRQMRTAGKQNGALHFNGNNDYVITEIPAFDQGEFTIAAWLKPEASGHLFSRISDDASKNRWAIALNQEGQVLEFLWGNEGQAMLERICRQELALQPEQWIHLAVTIRGKEGRLYLDGRIAQRWELPSASFSDSSAPLLLGAMRPGIKSYKGVMDDVYVYERALQEDEILTLSAAAPDLPGHRELAALNPQEAAIALSEEFWDKAETVVLCHEADYGNALIASTIAARLKVPLFFFGDEGVSPATRARVQALSTRNLIAVGGQDLGFRSPYLTQLKDTGAVLDWMQSRGLNVEYLAAANPRDRHLGRVRKVSLNAPLLAAARSGMVALLDLDTQWQLPFQADFEGDLPGSPQTNPKDKVGRIQLGDEVLFFTVNGQDPWAEIYQANGSHRGRYRTGYEMAINGRNYTVALYPEAGMGKADLRLSSPTHSEIQQIFRRWYERLDGGMEYLCILGDPDVIPHALIPRGRNTTEELPSDQPYANLDDDPFIEVALGRIVGEDVFSATLSTVRGLVYEELLDPSWANRMGFAGWDINTRDFEDHGYIPLPRHTGKEGYLNPQSPLCSAGLLIHGAHAWWIELGGFYKWNSRVLIAPALVESGGCSIMRLDRDEWGRAAPKRLLRNGAVCVAGNIRNGIAEQQFYRKEFRNAILQNQTVGQAHRYALNRSMASLLDMNQIHGGHDRYQYYIRQLFGDPAIRIHLPGAGSIKPARTEQDKSLVTVLPPEKWYFGTTETSAAWNSKVDEVHHADAPGIGIQSRWNHNARHESKSYFYTVEARVEGALTGIEQMEHWPDPLHWNGSYWIDEHSDGTRSVFWRVKILELDEYTGKAIKPDGPILFNLKNELNR